LLLIVYIFTFDNLTVQQTVTVGDVDGHAFFRRKVLEPHASCIKKGKRIKTRKEDRENLTK